MPDRPLAGEAPPADISAFPPGTVWMQIIERAADATGKTVGVNLFVKGNTMADFVGYNIGAPGYDMPGGPFIATQKPTTWTTAPTGSAPGQVAVADIVVAHPHFYHFEAHVGSVKIHCDCQVAKPDETQMGPDYDSEAIFRNTVQGRIAQERLNVADMKRPKAIIGPPNNKGIAPRPVKMPRRVP